MKLNIAKIDENKLPIKYILGIQEDLENFPDALDIIHIYAVESVKKPEKPRENFTKHSLTRYHSNGNLENAERGLKEAIELGLIEQTNETEGKEAYRIKINPFQ